MDKQQQPNVINVWGLANIGCTMQNPTFQTLAASDGGNQVEEPEEGTRNGFDEELLARAIENCQQYFWGNVSYAVVFCICRDDYKKCFARSDFEEMIEQLPYKKQRSYCCLAGTIANAFYNNKIFNEPIDEWDKFNPLARITKLRDELRKELKL